MSLRDDPAPVRRTGNAQRAAVSRYSRRVRWMKIVLPVVALALIGTIFLAGRRLDQAQSLLSPEEIAALSAGLRLENPRIAGRTESGEPFILQALWAEPESAMPDRISLERPRGEVTLADGRLLTGRAATGLLERGEGRMWLENGVTLETSDGYRFETERLKVLLGTREAEAPGPVQGEGPRGSIEAGTMQITSEPTGGGARGAARIVFQDRVRVVFIPNTPAADAADAGASSTEEGSP
ncbi:hypothetical protein LNKW23_41120 [Paralimibaculum aggregatum]|uniref:LPS export ABC transporter periplasmic protein LptC n=1 Tax=Paralimibaculum aggregatum TaxID=3036245 RepID=A0ABQ6LQ97_9RHOB|nr:LPS export ABC transporter periplasmic protein LptC [Limibaculum sp. NKW23]GMG84896.1 hypothetical protein LNKW23_41120 [Limibaculum sp. NKW23]